MDSPAPRQRFTPSQALHLAAGGDARPDWQRSSRPEADDTEEPDAPDRLEG